MFEVVDLQSVWALAQVYEHQLGLVREGQAVEASVEAFPGETFPGTVEFIEPRLDPTTRTVLVRFALENPELSCRPGMFATVSLQTPVAELPRFRMRAAENRANGAEGAVAWQCRKAERLPGDERGPGLDGRANRGSGRRAGRSGRAAVRARPSSRPSPRVSGAILAAAAAVRCSACRSRR